MVERVDRDGAQLAEHLIELDGSWALWRWAGLRSAGFPVEQVLELGDAECAQAADALLDAEQNARECRRQGLLALEDLRARTRDVDTELRSLLRRGIRWLKRGKRLPELESVVPAEVAAVLDSFETAEKRLEVARGACSLAFDEVWVRLSRRLSQTAGEGRFREALLWQNRHAFKNSLDSFRLRKNDKRGSKVRTSERLVTLYLQRYGLKNETIGFFGPLAWARLASEGEIITAEPGPELLETRNTYFEGWGIDALAEVLGRDEAMRPWLRPRRFPYLVFQGSTVHRPEGPVQLSKAAMVLLDRARGQKSAAELAAELTSRSDLGFSDAKEVYALLDDLRAQGLLAWCLEIPLAVNPERALRRELEQIGDPTVREPALRKLEELEEARAGVARAAGDADALDQALENLGTIFTRLTGRASERSGGKGTAMGRSRSLVYEDCRRDIDVTLGPELLQALAPPLSLLLTSARWLSQQMASKYRQLFRLLFRELCAQSGSPAVPLALFFQQAIARISAPGRELAADFQQRWQLLLPTRPGQRAVSFRCEDLWSQAQELFASTAPGWRNARYQCPDILLAAESAEEIRKGHYQFVLGEFHSTVNTLGMELFLTQHPEREQLQQAFAKDLSTVGVHVVLPKSWTAGAGREIPGMPVLRATTRSNVGLTSPLDNYLELAADPTGAPSGQALPIGSSTVVEQQGALGVMSSAGDFLDILDVFYLPLTHIACGIFKFDSPHSHTPRLSLDRLVLQRESWRCPVSEMSFLDKSDEQQRFLGVRRWAREKNLPPLLFFKSPLEMKPVFLNLDSPPSVEVFAKMIRRVAQGDSPSGVIGVSEMLPGPDQLWLRDIEGRRYTSELRFAALDRTALDP